MDHYAEQARQFCRETGTHVTFRRLKVVDRFPGDPNPTGLRYKYRVTIERHGRRYTTPFYDSVMNFREGRRPTPYDALACIQKYDPGRFWDFVREFGFEISSEESFNRAAKTHLACVREYAAVKELLGDVMDQLREIN